MLTVLRSPCVCEHNLFSIEGLKKNALSLEVAETACKDLRGEAIINNRERQRQFVCVCEPRVPSHRGEHVERQATRHVNQAAFHRNCK